MLPELTAVTPRQSGLLAFVRERLEVTWYLRTMIQQGIG